MQWPADFIAQLTLQQRSLLDGDAVEPRLRALADASPCTRVGAALRRCDAPIIGLSMGVTRYRLTAHCPVSLSRISIVVTTPLGTSRLAACVATKPLSVYSARAPAFVSVTWSLSSVAPWSAAHADTSSIRRRPVPWRRYAGSTHIADIRATSRSSLRMRPAVIPANSSQATATNTADCGESAASVAQLRHVSSGCPSASTRGSENTSGASASARSRSSRRHGHSCAATRRTRISSVTPFISRCLALAKALAQPASFECAWLMEHGGLQCSPSLIDTAATGVPTRPTGVPTRPSR